VRGGTDSAAGSRGAKWKLTAGIAGARPSYANVRCENRKPGAAETGRTGVSETERPGVSEPARSCLRPPSVEAGLTDPATTVQAGLMGPATTNPMSARAGPITSSKRVMDVRPRRTIESVQPSASVGHVRYAR